MPRHAEIQLTVAVDGAISAFSLHIVTRPDIRLHGTPAHTHNMRTPSEPPHEIHTNARHTNIRSKGTRTRPCTHLPVFCVSLLPVRLGVPAKDVHEVPAHGRSVVVARDWPRPWCQCACGCVCEGLRVLTCTGVCVRARVCVCLCVCALEYPPKTYMKSPHTAAAW